MTFTRTKSLLLSALLAALSHNALAGTVLKIATLSPEGSYWMEKMRAGADEVEKKTEGRVSFKFYPGGVMGDDATVLRKMRMHQLQGAAVTSGSLNSIYPDMQQYNLPLRFQNEQEVDFVRQKMDAELMKGLEEQGVVALGFGEFGFAYMMSVAPIRNFDDMRAQKTWAPEDNKIAVGALQAFSVSPIPLPLRDVLMGLQTGMINAVAGSPVGALALQWHTKVKYVSDLPLLYLYGALVLDKPVFDELSPADQQTVRTVMGAASKEIDQHSRQDNQKAAEAMKAQGIEFLKPTDEAVAEFHQKIAAANAELEKTGGLSADKSAKIAALLNEFRAGKR
jgi:TRAP-type C4-dicarboxylate transport system substrate-binding protein